MGNEYIIALDLGIKNVGWAIINRDNAFIEKCGVAYFDSSKGAAGRRKFRASRRLKRRSLHRIERLAQLLVKNGINPQKTIDGKMLDNRITGLSEQIPLDNVVNIIYYFARHRGRIPFDDTKPEGEAMILKEGEYPCQFIKAYYDKYGVYRGSVDHSMASDNMKELRKILETQATYYSEITNSLIDNIIDIIMSKRKFFEGPGAPKINQLSPYGRYRTIDDIHQFKINPNYHKYLYESLIGKCKLAVGERCAPCYNFYAEEFNFFNDFINMRVVNTDELEEPYRKKVNEKGRLTGDTILEIRDMILNLSMVNINNVFKKVLGIKIDNIQGYRVNKKNQMEVSKFEFYLSFKKKFLEKDFIPSWLVDEDKTIYNKVVYVLTVSPSSVQIKEMLKDLISEYSFTDLEIDIFSEIKIAKNDKLKYHSLSEKMLLRTLDDMYKTDYQYNFMQLLTQYDYEKESREYIEKNYSKKTKEPFLMESNGVESIIANPQVKKTIRKAIAIINEIIKEKKSYPSVIAIESTKEMNSSKAKSAIISEQKYFEELRIKAKNFLNDNSFPITETNIRKALCYFETNGTCMYCGKPISENAIMSLEIEHILPISKSFNDSYNNITCSCRDCNAEKANRTPYYFLFPKGKFDDFVKRVKSLKLTDEKENNLLFTGDIDNSEIRFINRNLRDTAYASVALVQEVKKYQTFLKHKNGCIIDTFTTPGQLTTKIRRQLGIEEKDRSTNYHHAVDAAIVGSIVTTKIGEILVKAQNSRQYWFKNKQAITGLGTNVKNFTISNIESIKNINQDNIFISYEVKRDPKRELSNQNYIKVIEKNDQTYKILQIDNIYNLVFDDENKLSKTLDKLFDENDKKLELLCEKGDPKLFKLLKNIYMNNPNPKENLFFNYCIYANGLESDPTQFNYLIHGIRKNQGNPNSPIVKTLRYKKIINNPYILNKKKINAKENRYNEFVQAPHKEHTLVGLDSLAQYCIEIYYDIDKNQFVFLPIYAISVDLNNKVINKAEHYYQKNYCNIIGENNVILIGTIQTGECATIIKKDGTQYDVRYISYNKSSSRLEFAEVRTNKGVNMVKNDQAIIIYYTNILGKRYIRLDSREKI